MKKVNLNLLLTLTVVLVALCNQDLAAQTAQKIQSLTATKVKPVVNALLALMVVIAAGRAVYKWFFQQREAAGEIAALVIGIILWGAWAIFANEILQFFGVPITV
ncbi:MAG: hypothetical protein J0M08_06800 [Bacteroidetes bacterium]|nr:hypothetical protein [Bacteroidota bacterium]